MLSNIYNKLRKNTWPNHVKSIKNIIISDRAKQHVFDIKFFNKSLIDFIYLLYEIHRLLNRILKTGCYHKISCWLYRYKSNFMKPHNNKDDEYILMFHKPLFKKEMRLGKKHFYFQ